MLDHDGVDVDRVDVDAARGREDGNDMMSVAQHFLAKNKRPRAIKKRWTVEQQREYTACRKKLTNDKYYDKKKRDQAEHAALSADRKVSEEKTGSLEREKEILTRTLEHLRKVRGVVE